MLGIRREVHKLCNAEGIGGGHCVIVLSYIMGKMRKACSEGVGESKIA